VEAALGPPAQGQAASQIGLSLAGRE
jgi:hypothetical protein